MNEISQIKKINTLNVFMRHMIFNYLHKLILFDNHQQLKPTVLSTKILKFAHLIKMFLMTYFIKISYFYKMLNEQYHMHFHITEVINHIIYDEKIINIFFIID